MKKTVIRVICAWCNMHMYDKDGQGVEGISHAICEDCKKKFIEDIHGNTNRKTDCSKCTWRTSRDVCGVCKLEKEKGKKV